LISSLNSYYIFQLSNKRLSINFKNIPEKFWDIFLGMVSTIPKIIFKKNYLNSYLLTDIIPCYDNFF